MLHQPDTIHVLLADDQPECHEAMHLVLDGIPHLQICGQAMNGEELVQLASNLQPQLVITDLKMPEHNGIEATAIIRDIYPHIKILGLTMFNQQNLIVQMMQAGAHGYIIKHADKESLIKAIHTVMNGQPYFCESTTLQLANMLAGGRFNNFATTKLPDDFFARHEKEILQLICRQLSSKQIADVLGLADTSVEKYRNTLMHKTGSQNMVGLVLFAIKHGIAPAPL